MNTLKRIVSYSPYLLILLVVLPVFAQAQEIFSIKYVLWLFVNNVFGFLIGAAGTLLDFAVNNYVINFGTTWGIGGSGVGAAVDMSWVIVRDVFNITFIFGLVWLGFKMILRSDDSSTRRTLITLIMAALLVNFSLFITKFVVDFTNILATEIAGAFQNPPEGATASPADPAEVSSAFMQLFGLQTIWEFAASGEKGPADPGDVSYSYIFGTAIVFMIGAFTFAAGGIMLIIRFAALCIYMVFSPLMFLGWVFPGLQSVSSKYWSGFLGRAFFAPAYLMLVYLAAFVMGSYNNTAPGFKNALSGDQFDAVATTIGPFMLTCVFLIASVVVAGKMSADGASTAIKLGQNIRGRAQKGVRNAALFVPRKVGGVAARGATGAAARGARRLDNRLLSSDSKFANYTNKILEKTPIDARTRNNLIEGGLNAKMGLNYSTADNEKNRLEQQKRRNKLQDERGRTELFGNNVNFAADGNKAAGGEMAKAIGKMSVEEISKINPVLLKDKAVASKLSDAQIKEMGDSGYYDNAAMKAIKTARDVGTFSETFEALENTEATVDEFNGALEELATTVRGLSSDRLEGMDIKTLTKEGVATNFTQAQMDKLQSSDKLSTDQKEQIKNARATGFDSIASNGTVVPIPNSHNISVVQSKEIVKKRREKLFSQSSQDAGKLPPGVFSEPKMAEFITPQALEQRMRNGITEEDRIQIRNNIDGHIVELTGKPDEKRVTKMWRDWSNRDFGARLGLTQVGLED